MLKSETSRYSIGDRKLILIIEDEYVNLEILKNVLKQDYEILTAENGKEALDAIRENSMRLSLVLLDLNLPDMNGMDILRTMRSEPALMQLPVVVLTSDREAEVESLDEGAMDFIPKPYPRHEVILARVRRTIELSENRIIIGQTELDSLTGLYNREYFYSYSEHFDVTHEGLDMDAIVININHFHMVNERYGRAYGDEVLERLGAKLKAVAVEHSGLACRNSADDFLLYIAHGEDYNGMLAYLTEGASGEDKAESVIRLRMGVYPHADKHIDMERRFDRAKMAADTVKSTFTTGVAIYDNDLHESAVFGEQLLVDFPSAIEEEQFKVYFQPKYDIRGDVPVLSSAEALVRWEHPEFGMVSPGVFINLFEKNGLIPQMDRYVWRMTARQMRDWRERLGVTIPVSVNVSRVDMFDPDVKDVMAEIVAEYGISSKDLILEVTESAYTEDSDHIISTVEDFRKMGFFIEMDDFGSGYSSLNMLSNLPIDALKLDMQFIRSAFSEGKDTRMIEIVIEIADSLGVPVIAEGVETAEQLFTLKQMGCDIVQGYYFSKPVPPEQFEEFFSGHINSGSEHRDTSAARSYRKVKHDNFTYEAMHDPLTGLYNHSAFDIILRDADQRHSILLLVDIDGYREAAENEGAAAADELVLRTADVLRKTFRSTDLICRIRDDEFAVILTRVNSSEKEVIDSKIKSVEEYLSDTSDGKPAVSISAGIAYGDEKHITGDIFTDADMSLNGEEI